MNLKPASSWSYPCDFLVEGMCINSKYLKNYNDQAGECEGGIWIRDKALYNHEDSIGTQDGDININPDDKFEQR